MRAIFAIHIAAGTLALASGYLALWAPKGGAVHRKGGMVFAWTMLAMCVAGALLAALRIGYWSIINLAAATSTAYLVITSLVTVRPVAGWTRRLDIGLMLLALAIGLTMLGLGIAAATGGGSWNTIPAFPFFLFGTVGLLGASGDMRVLRAGPPRGTARLTRHLWRMTFALFIAAMSFFFGQAKVIPKPLRIMPLLALPVLAVLVTLLYWLWRVRVRRSLRGVGTARMARAA
jgi:uncharacterized membrane protein